MSGEEVASSPRVRNLEAWRLALVSSLLPLSPSLYSAQNLPVGGVVTFPSRVSLPPQFYLSLSKLV